MFEDVNPKSGERQPGLFPEMAEPEAHDEVTPPEGAPKPQNGTRSETVSSEPAAGEEGPSEEPEQAAELERWKDALRHDFEQWLAAVEEVPDAESLELEPAEAPDLYSFYEQLAAATAESRKANRRTAEAISQWGDTLSRFDASLEPLRETVSELVAAQPKGTELSRAHCLVLAEWLDRLYRIHQAFGVAPAKTPWWGGNDRGWRRAWENQKQALSIVISHIEAFLKKEGVTRLETEGRPFDPATMSAVAVEPNAVHPAQTVLEELAAGYRHNGELLRSAQVKVSRKP